MDSPHKQIVRKYIDGFNRLDDDQVQSCLGETMRWTLFGHYRLTGKSTDHKQINGPPGCKGPPRITIRRMVEEGDTVMAELLSEVDRIDGGMIRLAMAEIYVFEDGLISERRAFATPLVENDFR